MHKRITLSAAPKKLQISATASRKDDISFSLHRAQSGKTTFFQRALDALPTASTEIAGANAEPTYFPIRLNFEEYEDFIPSAFYASFYREIRKEIEGVFRKRRSTLSETLNQFLENARITDHVEMREFFEHLVSFLDNQKVVLVIDEFDGIPRAAVRVSCIRSAASTSPVNLDVLTVSVLSALKASHN